MKYHCISVGFSSQQRQILKWVFSLKLKVKDTLNEAFLPLSRSLFKIRGAQKLNSASPRLFLTLGKQSRPDERREIFSVFWC